MHKTHSCTHFRLTDRAWYLIAFGTWTACLVVGAIGYNAVTW